MQLWVIGGIRRRSHRVVESHQLAQPILETRWIEIQRHQRQHRDAVALQLHFLPPSTVVLCERPLELRPELFVTDFVSDQRLDLGAGEQSQRRPGHEQDRSLVQPDDRLGRRSQPEAYFPAMGPVATWGVIGLFPQMTAWIGWTLVAGGLTGSITAALMRGRRRAAVATAA